MRRAFASTHSSPIEGHQFAQVIDGNVDVPALNVSLPSGAYRLRLIDGWFLERSLNGGPFEVIGAQLASPNPRDVNILSSGITFGGFESWSPTQTAAAR